MGPVLSLPACPVMFISNARLFARSSATHVHSQTTIHASVKIHPPVQPSNDRQNIIPMMLDRHADVSCG
eukprot:364619-Chlamydomonas_euryale.AAC.5